MKTYSNRNKKNIYKIFSLNKKSDWKEKNRNCATYSYLHNIVQSKRGWNICYKRKQRINWNFINCINFQRNAYKRIKQKKNEKSRTKKSDDFCHNLKTIFNYFIRMIEEIKKIMVISKTWYIRPKKTRKCKKY